MTFFLAFLFCLLTGCGEPPECSATEPCPFGATCVEGVCQESRCATSAQCAMEHHCSSGRCVAGCAADEDCYPGNTCRAETGECEEEACEDAQRDCAFKEFCNGVTGECYEAAGYYCRSCVTDEDCGGESSGNHCTSYGFCGVDCQTRSDCPAGFDCIPFVDGYGNVQYYQCFTYCWLYETAGAIGEPYVVFPGRPEPLFHPGDAP